jgi:dienelactone hydrolase
LVVFATGFGGDSLNYAPMYDHWVEAGYVIAAPTFPLSNENAPGGQTIADLPSQPGDVSFVLDEMLRLNRSRKSKLRGLIDPKRVGLVGKSLGAITVLEVGYSQADHDPRFKAVIPLTGIVNGDITQHFQGIDTPMLVEHGDADTTVPIGGSADAFEHAAAPKFFVTLIGATHGNAFQGGDTPAEKVVVSTTIDFLDAYVKGKTAAVSRLQRDADVAGVATLQCEL